MTSISCEDLNTVYDCLYHNSQSKTCGGISNITDFLDSQNTISEDCVNNINGDSSYLSSNQIYDDIKAINKNNIILIIMKIVVVLIMIFLIFLLYIYNVPADDVQ